MDKKVTGIISYLGFIGWIIAYCAGDKEGAKFHLNQSLVLAIVELAVSVLGSILGVIPFVGLLFRLIVSLVGVVAFVFAILGIIAAANDEEKALPIIGTIQILK